MAVQSKIFAAENAIVEAAFQASEALGEYRYELATEDKEGHPYPENRDCWGTLYANAKRLQRELDRLTKQMESEFAADMDHFRRMWEAR